MVTGIVFLVFIFIRRKFCSLHLEVSDCIILSYRMKQSNTCYIVFLELVRFLVSLLCHFLSYFKSLVYIMLLIQLAYASIVLVHLNVT